MLGWDYVASLRFPFLRGPSSTEAKARPARAGRFFRAPIVLMRASSQRPIATRKKRNFMRLRFCFGRDSVGIRTQDPQLRRLLLYPTELPNRSLFSSVITKVGAKIWIFFEKCNTCLIMLLKMRISRILLPVAGGLCGGTCRCRGANGGPGRCRFGCRR